MIECPFLTFTPAMPSTMLQNSLNHLKQLMRYDYDPDYKEPEKIVPAKKHQRGNNVTHGKVFRLKKTLSATSVSSGSSTSDEEEENAAEELEQKKKPNGRYINFSICSSFTVKSQMTGVVPAADILLN